MQEIKDRLQTLQEEVKKSLTHLDLPSKEARLKELEAKMSEPDFWSDAEKAQKISRDAGLIRGTITKWRTIEKDVQNLLELADMVDPSTDPASAKQIEEDTKKAEELHHELSTELYLSGPYDGDAAIVSFHAGTGGTDAQDFAEMLVRMILRYAERKEWKVTQLHSTPGSEAGLKSASYKIDGPFAYGYLKHENGVHRLVRLSPFNSGSTRETSFAMIEVVPDLDEQDLEIKDTDIKWDVFRAGGQGGQSVNTTDSAVRLTHIPTGIVISSQNERSQLQNKQTALKVLKGKLVALQEKLHLAAISEIRGEHVETSWGNQIRSYVLHPYQMVKDHRTDHETSQVDKVLDGDLDDFIEASLKAN